ncbi:MAG: co-chaperone YbbN [Rhizobiaceae bacterium]
MSNEEKTPKQNISYTISGSMGGGTVSAGLDSSEIGGARSGDRGMAATPDFSPSEPTVAPESKGPIIKDISTEGFLADVIEASKQAPVIVDFWAPWCGPCKQLGPIIEKAVTDAANAGHGITLCKMDVEKYPDISQQMGIKSIPAVVSFVDGRPADGFMGAKTESEVRAFVDKVAALGPPVEGGGMAQALDKANEFAAKGEHAEAAEIYSLILEHEPGNLDAFAGLGFCYVAVGEFDMAQKLIDKIPQEYRDQEALIALMKSIELAKQGSELGELSELAAAADADPKNYQARFDYALALNTNGDREEAAEQLILIVRKDRKWKDDGARAQLLEFFVSWGNADPATNFGRRALSAVIFS